MDQAGHQAAAMKVHLADQKAVLVFKEGEAGGSAALYKFEAKGSLNDIHNALLEDGAIFHTLVPHAGGVLLSMWRTSIDRRKAR